ncbi:hypothetical protein M9Y10_005502 [Tritrichomonas musculus]|uniref:Tubby C-terminal domain-containing protein n=1 Tax=Tritrichomonas musculus TaxID=1915356 RepID=A0ABR2JC02_9EUKA
MNDGIEPNVIKGNMKTNVNNIFLSSRLSQCNEKNPSKNIFLLPSEETRNRVFHIKSKHRQTLPTSTTFSDYSIDDTLNDNTQSDTMNISSTFSEKDEEYEDESSNFMQKKCSTHSIGAFQVKSERGYSINSQNIDDDTNLHAISTSSQMHKGNSHHVIQTFHDVLFDQKIQPKNRNDKPFFVQQNPTKPTLLSDELRVKINNKATLLRTYRLITKRKYREVGRTAHFIFTDGENILFDIYQNKQQTNLFDIYTANFTLDMSTKLGINLNQKQDLSSQSTSQSHCNISLPKLPIATVLMEDTKGSVFFLYKPNIKGQLLLKVQYIKTIFTGYYRSTIVTFHKNISHDISISQYSSSQPTLPSSGSSSVSLLFETSSSEDSNIKTDTKQRLWSQQPPLDKNGHPVFSFPDNLFFVDSIRNMNLCNKDSDKTYISIRKVASDKIEIDTYFRANLLWLVGIALSDCISSIH